MSRSIHTTRRTLAKVRASDFANEDDKTNAIAEQRRRLRRKRRIKWLVDAERRREKPPLAGSAISTIPIEVLDEGDFVHHPATLDDLRAVLSALPSAAADGITRVQLHSGRAYIDERNDDSEAERDPLIGRLSYPVIPGVYAGITLGTYHSGTGLISLYGYVYDPESLPLPRAICEFYLKLHALKTFIHEVAHHHDFSERVRRGRWVADRTENVEWYAEKMEFLWMEDYVGPYLEVRYPALVSSLLEWVWQNAGARLSLDFLSGDDRRTERNGLTRLTFSTSAAFESWIKDGGHQKTPPNCWMAFAWELHYADEYEKCLEVIARVLASNPGHLPARALKADTFVHLERYAEALALADDVLALEPGHDKTWETRGRVFEARSDWAALFENGQKWRIASSSEQAKSGGSFQCAIACCALDDDVQMEAWLEKWAVCGNREMRMQYGRRAILRRAGKLVQMEADSSSS